MKLQSQTSHNFSRVSQLLEKGTNPGVKKNVTLVYEVSLPIVQGYGGTLSSARSLRAPHDMGALEPLIHYQHGAIVKMLESLIKSQIE